MFATLKACLLFFFDSISSFNLLMLKKARLSPENMADCVKQNPIPIQMKIFIIFTPYIKLTDGNFILDVSKYSKSAPVGQESYKKGAVLFSSAKNRTAPFLSIYRYLSLCLCIIYTFQLSLESHPVISQ
jgi:hypothetical protein